MMYESLHWVDYVVIILSLVVSIYIGVYYAKRQKSTNNYFAAGGNIPSWAVGISILATLISSITFLAYPGEGFSSNWIRLVQGMMVPVVLLFLVWFIVPLYRNVIGISAYEYFEKRFGFFARIYGSLGFILAHFSKMGTVFFLLALAISSMMGIDTFTVILVIGVIVIFITLLGGIEAVIWLDVVQGFMLIAGGLIALGVLLFTPEGGPAAIWNTAVENNRIGFGPFDWDFVNLTFWVMAINGIFYAIQKYGTDQTIIQRYLTAKSEKGAIRAALIGVLLSVPVWALFMFIGTAIFSYYQLTPATLPDGIRPHAVFPQLIMTELPMGVTGLILAALIAAAISSLDSDLNCLSAVGVEDYYKRFRPNSTDAQQLFMGKLFVAISGVGAIAVASIYLLAGNKGVLGIIFTLYAIFSGGIAGMFILGLFSKRANKKGLYIGIAASVLFTGWAVLTSTPFDIGGTKRLLLDMGDYNFGHHKYMLGVYSHFVLFGVGWVTSFFFKSEVPDKSLTIYSWIEKRRLEKASAAK